MSRTITLLKVADTTKIKIVDNGVTRLIYSNSSRDLEVYTTGVTITADPNETQLNNFKIDVAELTNDGIDFTGIATGEQLAEKIANEKLFKKGGGLGTDAVIPSINAQLDVNVTHISNLTFNVVANRFPVGNTWYASTAANVTLNDADATNNRIDLFVANIDGTVGKITGTPSANPLEPNYDASTQYPIRFVLIEANATTPVGYSSETVFNEGVGEPTEWTFDQWGTAAITTNDASVGSKSFETTDNSPLVFVNDVFKSTATLSAVTFSLKLKSSYNQSLIELIIGNATIQQKIWVDFLPQSSFDSNNLNWQELSVNLENYNIPIADFNYISIRLNKAGFNGYFVDNLKLHYNINQIPITPKYVLVKDKHTFIDDIKLLNYPNTRNDGQIPTNKILSTDVTGNLKMFSMALSPAPFLANLIPDNTHPSSTGDIHIWGDFFTPAMCDRVNNQNAIIVQGQTINNATFVNSQHIIINATTGATEGTFDLTLDNGISVTFPNALLIILGTVNKPINTSWVNQTNIDASITARLSIVTTNTLGVAELNTVFWSFTPNTGKRLDWNWTKSPLQNNTLLGGFNPIGFYFYRLDGTPIYHIYPYAAQQGSQAWRISVEDLITPSTSSAIINNTDFDNLDNYKFSFQKSASNVITLSLNGNVIWTPVHQEPLEMKIKAGVKDLDMTNILCIDLI